MEKKTYKFNIPYAPQSAYRPRLGNSRRSVTMDARYRVWREATGTWFDKWLKANDFDLVKHMFGTDINGEPYNTLRDVDGEPREEPVIDKKTGNVKLGKLRGNLRHDFSGWVVEIVFVLERPKDNLRYSPVSAQTADLDNYVKGVIDMMFESEIFQYVGFNDRYIQSQSLIKRYSKLNSDEKPHIEVSIRSL